MMNRQRGRYWRRSPRLKKPVRSPIRPRRGRRPRAKSRRPSRASKFPPEGFCKDLPRLFLFTERFRMTATQTSPMSEALHPSAGLIQVNGSSVEIAVEQLLAHAAKIGASDLFFGCNEQHVMVQIRHHGIVRPLTVLGPEHGRKVITLFKTRALLDLSEKRRPQEGRWLYQHAGPDGADASYDLRISVIPTACGEDLAIRLLNRASKLFSLEPLGLPRQQKNTLGGLLDSPGGLVLFTGPTGSGKTATMYTCLQHLNNGKRKINTIEDP